MPKDVLRPRPTGERPMGRRWSWTVLPPLISLFLGVAVPAPTLAAPPDRIAYLNKKAMEDYDSLEFDSARRTLLDAIALLRKQGKDESIQAARTYINLGMVYIALKDRGRGQQHFVKAIGINPNAKLDPTLATPDMQQVWEAATAQTKGLPPPPEPARPEPPQQPVQVTPPQQPIPTGPGPDATPGKPNQPLEYSADDLLDPVLQVNLAHNPLEETRAGQRANVYVTPSPKHAGAVASRVVLYYRGPGQERYSEVPMQPSGRGGGELSGTIPGEAVIGRTLQYYIAAYDMKNRQCGIVGAADSPQIVRVLGVAGIAARQVEDMEDPIKYAKRAEEEARLKLLRDYVYIDVGIGTGGSIITAGSTTEVAWFYNRGPGRFEQARSSSTGFIWSGLGARIEAGAFVWRGLSIGLSGRFEAYLSHNADSTANTPDCALNPASKTPCYAPTTRGQFGYMVLGKVRYAFRPGHYFRPYLHLDFGGGEWRGALNIDGSRPTSNGQIDASSPYQPTDLCSAEYNGNPQNRQPSGCSSVGNQPGYNKQDFTVSNASIVNNLNRTCPKMGSCIDSVLMGKGFVGIGAGFYLGGRHVGMSVDLNLLTSVGGQFGLFIDTYVGPQVVF
jgi:hypothetical protein